uniref:Uncharacterized protein n=1 Tax=Oryza punctata TaxID=4537 RepID=A0A0E0KZH9_ORYPU
MEAADHGRGSGAGLLAVAAAPAPVLTMHERKLSQSSYSFSSAAASLSSPTSSTSSRSYHAAMSGKSLSCESIPEMDKQSSFSSSASSYESFFQLEAADLDRITAAATRAPAVQTMMASHEQQQLAGAGSGGGYDPRRLPSSMFRTGSTSSGGGGDMVDWSVTSNDSLFSINLRHSGDLSARYTNSNHSGDLFYDASGGLCVSDSCARCIIAAGKNRKSVRFASDAEIVSGEITNPSAVFPRLADAMGEAPATEGKETAKSTDAAAQGGWCLFRCCWPSPPSVWWPGCGCGGGGCGVFCCGESCRR